MFFIVCSMSRNIHRNLFGQLQVMVFSFSLFSVCLIELNSWATAQPPTSNPKLFLTKFYILFSLHWIQRAPQLGHTLGLSSPPHTPSMWEVQEIPKPTSVCPSHILALGKFIYQSDQLGIDSQKIHADIHASSFRDTN